MTQQLFDDLTAEQPPSTIDVPGIVRQEKRRRTFVRAGVPAAAVLAVVSAVAVLAPDGGPAPGPSTVAGPPPASHSASAAAPGFRLVANDKATAAATATTLRAALDTAVRQAAPGTAWLAQATATKTPDGQPPLLQSVQVGLIVRDGPARPGEQIQMFTGQTGVSLAGRRGTLSLHVDAPSSAPCTDGKPATCQIEADLREGLLTCLPAAPKCTASTGKDGRRQRVQTSTSPGGYLNQETTVELADGRALTIAVNNEFLPPGKKGSTDNVAQSATPLSPAQVTAIATTIGDRILP